ncbi:MAG: diguanylate cyclase, partial [Candidatus Eremiobacteraeota bacterium]|nr:diguanylate cyclase [Candidatus Eremiobacteraeota bacterium]
MRTVSHDHGGRVISEPHREHRDRELIRQAATLLAAGMSLGELFERLCEMLADYIDSSVVFIGLIQPDGNCTIEYFHDHGVIRRAPHISLSPGSSSWEVIHTGRVIWGNQAEDWIVTSRIPINKDAPETDDTISAIFVPLKIGESTIGCLSVQSNKSDAYNADEVDLIAAIARYLAVAVENQRMVRALQEAADIDALTGLVNHSKLLRELDSMLERAVSVPVAAVLLNITNFAMFNDTFGYPEGDKVLRQVAEALRAYVDDRTILGRYGGDVFLFLMAGRTKEQVRGFVDAIAQSCRNLQYRNQERTIPITVACGYALAPFDTVTRAELLSLSIHRARLSRKQGGGPVGEDDIDAYTLHGTFSGIETIVASLLDRDPYTRVHLF